MSCVEISILILQMTKQNKTKTKKERGKGDGKREISGSCRYMKFILYVKRKGKCYLELIRGKHFFYEKK